MSFFSHALRGASKFGNKLGRGARKFGGNALREAGHIEKFVEHKALPTLEKVAKGASTALKVAEPFAAIVAPEALPFLEGARQGLKVGQSALHQANKSIEIGHKVASTVHHLRKGDVPQAIAGGMEARKQASGLENPFKR
jgi:hypothetical protein